MCRAVEVRVQREPPPEVVGTAVPSTDPTAVPERDGTPKTLACPPMANPLGRLLAALLHVRPDELLRVLLEDLVDLVQDRVDVIGELFVPLPDLLGGPGLRLLGLVGAPSGLPLTACVLRSHVATSVCPNAIVTRGSPAQSGRAQIGTNSRPCPAGGYGEGQGADPGRSVLASQSWPVRAAPSSAAVRQRSSSSPTCALVPRSGSKVGTRCSDSRPGMSKMTGSQGAAATDSGYGREQRPRK